MRNALEYKAQFNSEGKLLKKEFSVGPSVPVAIVALVALCMGQYVPGGILGALSLSLKKWL